MKYIVLEIESDNSKYEMPFTFPDIINHYDFANSIKKNLIKNHDLKTEIVSAGFCNFFGSDSNCSGRSQTLNIESRGIKDDRLISMFNYEHGIVF